VCFLKKSQQHESRVFIQPKSGSYPVAGNAFGGLKVPSVDAIFSLT